MLAFWKPEPESKEMPVSGTSRRPSEVLGFGQPECSVSRDSLQTQHGVLKRGTENKTGFLSCMVECLFHSDIDS